LPAVYPYRSYTAGGGTGPIWARTSAAQQATSIAFSRARSRPTYRCRRRPHTKRWSISNGQGTRPHRSWDPARPRGRGDRI